MEKNSKDELSAAQLKREIEMQTKALKLISRWVVICLGVSGIGAVLCYFGFVRDTHRYLFGYTGAALMVVGLLVALVFAFGHRNGRRNVEHMINVLESQVTKPKGKKRKKKK